MFDLFLLQFYTQIIYTPPQKKTGLKSTKQKKRDQNWEVELQDFEFDDYASFLTLKEM